MHSWKERKVEIKIKISDERISGLLCCGFEGGVGYWCQIAGYEGREDETYPHTTLPLKPNAAVLCEEWEEEEPTLLRLDRAAVERGLKIMSEKYPRHFMNFVCENEDAETGDVFIQCCLLGDVVYG
jgi:hypothetical protein